jgi:hypothetical protein
MVAIPTFTHDNTSTAVENPLLGWTHEPQGRGTWTLILSSLSTTFLCTWVVIHPRIDRRFRHRILHKIARESALAYSVRVAAPDRAYALE